MSKDLSSSGSGKNKIIHTIVILALFFLFRYIPPFGSVTEVGMAVPVSYTHLTLPTN